MSDDTEIQDPPVTLPPVGIHRGVPAEVYHAWPLPSNSRLTTLRRSPAHLKYELEHPTPPTAAMRLGTALHAAVLEPSAFAETYAVLPDFGDLRSSKARAERDLFMVDHSDVQFLTPGDFAAVESMRNSIFSVAPAFALLDAASEVELSAVFDEPVSGQRCKFRADGIVSEPAVIFDLKTTIDASPESFAKSVFNFGYHRQAALYLHGAAAVGLTIDAFVILAVENTPPYAAAAYRIMDEAVEAGWDELSRLLDRYARCDRAGEWPAYPDKIIDLALPAWAMRRSS